MDGFINKSESSAFEEIKEFPGKEFPIEQELFLVINRAVKSLDIQDAEITIRDRSISVRVPFQQTVPLVNKLHEMLKK